MENETREKVKYTCENCGDIIPYASKRAMSDNDYNDFCSQECFNEYYGLRSIDWQSRSEYRRYTRGEIKAMTKAHEEERKRKKADEDAKRKEAEPLFRHIETTIMDLVKDENE